MSLTQRFINAEAHFLAAIESGSPALALFDKEWKTLGEEFEDAMNRSLLEPGEVETIYAISSRIAILGDSFLQLEEASTNTNAKWLTDISTALSELSLKDMQKKAQDGAQPVVSVPHQRTLPYKADAFSWLLNNVHDPYPSSSLKRRWARDSQVTIRVMDDWFKSIRKEIGWVELTKAYFSGSRSTAVQSASAVFLDNGGDAAVPFEVQTELFAIKARLENLFLEERGLVAGPSMRTPHKRPRSASVSSSATDITPSSRSLSPSAPQYNSSDETSTASSSPSRASSRLPSLVFDQSDSEEDEQFPEFSTPGLRDDAAIRVADLVKDDDTSERLLKRRRHSYYDLSVEDSPSSWPIDPFVQLIDTQFILPNDLAAPPDFWSFTMPSPQTSTIPMVDATPTVDRVSASPVASTSSRKRRHEDAELEAPGSKKSRGTRSLPRSNARKEQKASGATPVLVANVPPAPLEPIVINWEQLLKDLEEATSKKGDGSFDASGPVDCGVFDFAALEPAASTSIPNVDDSWDKLFSADVPGSDSAPTMEELLASFTNVDALAGPDFPASADVSTVSIELPLPPSSDFGLGTELTSEWPAYELHPSTTSPLAQAGEPEVFSLCNGFDNTTQLTIPDSTEVSPLIFDVLSHLDSGGSFDTYLPPLVAF